MVSIYRVEAGIRHGRDEQEKWIVQFQGPANIKIRRKFGKPLPPRGKMLQTFINNHPGHPRENWGYGRHSWRRGATHYWSRVNKIESVPAPPVMFDLCLAEDPHSYCTMAGVVHNSEAAFYDNWAQVNRSIVQAVGDSGNVVLESTARGFNHFKDIVDAAISGSSLYNLIFYPWFAFPDYRQPIDPGEAERIMRSLDAEERALVDRGVKPDQLAWRRMKLSGMDLLDFHQEFPASIMEAFISTGRPAFSMTVVVKNWEATKVAAREGLGMQRDEFTTIFFPPEPGGVYLLSADPAEGIDKGEGDPGQEVGGEDYSSASVHDSATLRTMATIHGRLDPADFGRRLVNLGYEYNDAMIAVERNNHGHLVLYVLNEAGYPNLYRHLEYDAAGMSFLKLGFPMTVTTRPLVVDCLREVVRRDGLPDPDPGFWRECSTFTYNPMGKPEAQTKRHDDRVMDRAIGIYLCTLGAGAWGGSGMLANADGANMPSGRPAPVGAAAPAAPPAPPKIPIMAGALVTSFSPGGMSFPVASEPASPDAAPGAPEDSPVSALLSEDAACPMLANLAAARADFRRDDAPCCGNCCHKCERNGTLVCRPNGWGIQATDPACAVWDAAQDAGYNDPGTYRVDIGGPQ